MNLGFMQELAVRKKQGENLGSAEALLAASPGMRLGTGLNIQAQTTGQPQAVDTIESVKESPSQQTQSAPLTLGATFANEIVRRMGGAEGDAGTQTDQDGQSKDNTDLRHSLGQTMDWIRDQYGDEAAAAASGMILQSTSSGVTEESLGDGLLNTLKFIDRNFGIAAGDTAIAKFNQGINAEINEYFDNGKAEIFYAAESTTSETSQSQSLTTRLYTRAVQTTTASDEDALSVTEQLLEDLKNELDKVAELQDLTTQLETAFSPTASARQSAIAAYTDPPVQAQPQFTDTAV